MSNVIDPVPAIYQMYGNDIKTLQQSRIAASKKCTDSCNRIRRNYGYWDDTMYNQCREKCQEMANTIIQYEQQPYDGTLYNYQGYWGSYGTFGDHYFINCDKKKSFELCLGDCDTLPNPNDVRDCKQNCYVDVVALRDINLDCGKKHMDKETESNSLFYLLPVSILIVILFFIFQK